VCNNFIDFKQTSDSLWQADLWQFLRHFGVPENMVGLTLLEDLYNKSCRAVSVDGQLSPGPHRRSLQRYPDSLADLSGTTSKGRGREGKQNKG